MAAPRNTGPRFFSRAKDPAQVAAERAKKAKAAARAVPQLDPVLESAVKQLRTSDQFSEEQVRKSFAHYARGK